MAGRPDYCCLQPSRLPLLASCELPACVTGLSALVEHAVSTYCPSRSASCSQPYTYTTAAVDEQTVTFDSPKIYLLMQQWQLSAARCTDATLLLTLLWAAPRPERSQLLRAADLTAVSYDCKSTWGQNALCCCPAAVLCCADSCRLLGVAELALLQALITRPGREQPAQHLGTPLADPTITKHGCPRLHSQPRTAPNPSLLPISPAPALHKHHARTLTKPMSVAYSLKH